MKGISMDEDRIESIRNWSREKKTVNGWLIILFEVQQFLGFCNCYWQLISKHSEQAEPLTRLPKKDEPFVSESEQQLAFDTMVTAFRTALVLWHFTHDREVIIETDASDYVSTGVLPQYNDDGVLHPVFYYSKERPPAKCNHDIYHKELEAIIKALEEWRPECEGVAYPLKQLTDHMIVEYFMTKKLLKRWQAWWLEFWTRFDYEIV